MERTGIEPVTSGLQSREGRTTGNDERRRAASNAAWLLARTVFEPHA
jgi:hypothetical protein